MLKDLRINVLNRIYMIYKCAQFDQSTLELSAPATAASGSDLRSPTFRRLSFGLS